MEKGPSTDSKKKDEDKKRVEEKKGIKDYVVPTVTGLSGVSSISFLLASDTTHKTSTDVNKYCRDPNSREANNRRQMDNRPQYRNDDDDDRRAEEEHGACNVI